MSKGIGKPLTVDLVVSKTKCDSLHNLKNLNLWGNDLQDLKLLRGMGNLEVVSLSVNRISTLKEFGYCPKLQELYLRKNNIADLREIKYLFKLQNLKVLWLHDNPCALTQNYREIVIKYLPNLTKLDNNPILAQQKASAQKVNFNFDDYEDENEPRSSKLLNKNEYQQKKGENLQQKILLPQRNSRNNYEQKVGYQVQNKNVKGQQVLSYQKIKQLPQLQQKNENSFQGMQRNKNILMAVISLLKQLDQNSLEITRLQIQKTLSIKRR